MRAECEISDDHVHPLCKWKTAERLVSKLVTATKAPLRSPERRTKVARWRQITIAQFGFVTNTVLVLTTASIGFAFGQASMLPETPRRAVLIGVVFLGMSGLFALVCSWNRLLDFRLTAQVPRASEQSDLKEARDDAKLITHDLGLQSWCFLRCQLFTFGLGIFIVGVVLGWSLWTGNILLPNQR